VAHREVAAHELGGSILKADGQSSARIDPIRKWVWLADCVGKARTFASNKEPPVALRNLIKAIP
jgi:hypothetical protein